MHVYIFCLFCFRLHYGNVWPKMLLVFNLSATDHNNRCLPSNVSLYIQLERFHFFQTALCEKGDRFMIDKEFSHWTRMSQVRQILISKMSKNPKLFGLYFITFVKNVTCNIIYKKENCSLSGQSTSHRCKNALDEQRKSFHFSLYCQLSHVQYTFFSEWLEK